MRYLMALLTLFAASVAQAQPKQLPKDFPPTLPKFVVKSEDDINYEWAYSKATEGKLWLVIYVGQPARQIGGTRGVSLSTFNGDSTPRIIYSKPDGTVRQATTVRSASSDDLAEFMGLGVSREARPFSRSGGSLRPGEVAAPAQPDGSDNWPVGLSFLSDLEPYTTARNTQISFRRDQGYIGAESRSVLEMKWIVPGHLAGINGWSSRLYRSRGVRPSVFLTYANSKDGAITWDRSYPDGAVFADVLRNTSGKVFEVRVAEKNAGKWERFVAFKDSTAAPHGYLPPTRQQCVSCHAEAGFSNYGGAAIPGGGTIISDPFPHVERGEVHQDGSGIRSISPGL